MAGRACRRSSMPAASRCGTRACLAFGLGPLLTMGAHRGACRARLGRPEGALSRQARIGRVDRDDEPDRAAGGLRPRRPAHPGRAGRRRHLSHHRPEDLHHLWRARPHRQHRPPRARAPARCAARHARHLALPRAESLGRRHAATTCAATRIEHKLGIHASPTCTMVYGDHGGAIGWLVGEENRGLACMFTMMNNARLAVGLQGVAIAERAYQQALAYAHERRQGRAPGCAGDGMSPIVEHPDVRRMLMTMKALTAAARAICYLTAVAIDRAHHRGRRMPPERARARVASDAGRQGLLDRHRRRGRLARRAGAWRHGLHRGDRRRPAPARCAHPARSTRARTASRRSTS